MSRKRRPRLAPGERIAPHLTVVGAIDAGGRDPVYIVWHGRSWCAMCCKLFRDPEQARWEAEALGRVAHPGLVRLIEDGSPDYVLTEFLEGPCLDRLLDRRPRHRLATGDALRVAIHLGAALAHLHERGLVHLDLKPANVIVTGRRPVLFDLGSARALDGRPLGRPQGTDAYMSPEQATGGIPTPASDIWGLGVTLFEMLAGARPFADGTGAEPFPQLARAPSALRSLRPRLPAGLAELIGRCLARDPSARPTLAELLPALNAQIPAGPRMWPALVGDRIGNDSPPAWTR